MFYCPLTDVCSMGRCLIVLLVGGGGCHCPLVEMSASAQESACMRTPWRLQPTLSLKCLQVHWADVGEGSISVQSVFGRLGHGDLSDTLVSYEIYIL